jgi:hypothetical protein
VKTVLTFLVIGLVLILMGAVIGSYPDFLTFFLTVCFGAAVYLFDQVFRKDRLVVEVVKRGHPAVLVGLLIPCSLLCFLVPITWWGFYSTLAGLLDGQSVEVIRDEFQAGRRLPSGQYDTRLLLAMITVIAVGVTEILFFVLLDGPRSVWARLFSKEKIMGVEPVMDYCRNYPDAFLFVGLDSASGQLSFDVGESWAHLKTAKSPEARREVFLGELRRMPSLCHYRYAPLWEEWTEATCTVDIAERSRLYGSYGEFKEDILLSNS